MMKFLQISLAYYIFFLKINGANGQECPKSIGMCTEVYEPVVCPGGCNYGNACKAEAAGFREGQCDSLQCPLQEPTPSSSCKKEQVGQQCTYGEDCCDKLGEDGICTNEEQCNHSYECTCTEEGGETKWECFNTDFCMEGCECPKVDFCTKEYKPVVCRVPDSRFSCEYDNESCAASAGLNPKTDCKDKFLSEQCPLDTPDPNSPCPMNDETSSCKYGNECCKVLDGNVCEEQCSHSTECSCNNDFSTKPTWACLVTDFCNREECKATGEVTGGTFGDPHFKTWTGEMYDFHGICDLVLLENPSFEQGIGMDIHIRSKKTKQWSYISSAVVRIGDETFEVAGKKDGDTFWINKKTHNNGWKEGHSIAGYQISYRAVNTQQKEYIIHLGNEEKIAIKTWNNFVRVDVVNPETKSFGKSLGLLGSYPHGVKLARDNSTALIEGNEFGREWQVLASEPKLFHAIEGPQHPSSCEIPTKAVLRRRLADAQISLEDAEAACARVAKSERDMCVFDVMATGNTRVAVGAY